MTFRVYYPSVGDLHVYVPPVNYKGTEGLFLISTLTSLTVNDSSAAPFKNSVPECSLATHKELLHSRITVIFLNSETAIRISEQLEIRV